MWLLGRRSERAVKVGHVKAWHEEGGGDALGADVLLDRGFAVKVVDVGEFAAGELFHIE